MIGFIRDAVQRRKLRLVVKALPHVLSRRYGRGEFYTVGQVRTSAELLKVKPDLLTAAFAVACTAEDFVDAESKSSEQDYQTMREEIARLFWLKEADLNCRTLTFRFHNPSGITNSVDKKAAFHDSGAAGGGSPD